MKLNQKMLYELYMAEVNQISDDLDWKTSFGPEVIVNLIATIIETNNKVISE